MRTRSNTATGITVQSLRKRRSQSLGESSVTHFKMKAKKPILADKDRHHEQPRKTLKPPETRVGQIGNGLARKPQILPDNLLTKLQLEACNSTTRLSDREEDSESSGDEELPAIFDPSIPKVKELVPGVVVWAKARGWPHWPAVLVNFFCREKKAWVIFFDQTNQRVQVSSRSLVSFSGQNRSRLIELGNHNAAISVGFDEAVVRAEDYLIKRGLGKSSNCSTPIISEFDTSLHSPPASPPASPHSGSPRSHSPFMTSLSHNAKTSDETATNDEELRIGFPIEKYHLYTEDKPEEDAEILVSRQKAWQNTENRLLKYIHRDTTKNHLLAIYKGQTKSERHRLFGSTRKRDRQKLRSLVGLGPITDDEKQSDLSGFLSDLYVEQCMESKEDLPNLSYITEVWLPEAVIFAIQKTRRVGRSKAEDLFFSEGVQSLVDLGEDVPHCIPVQHERFSVL